MAVERDRDGLVTALCRAPGVRDASLVDGRIRVMVQGGDGVVGRLVALGLEHGLRDVSVTEPSLETVFIHLTGRELRD
jgi:ABC-2 type transport system ATP-binding protein